MAYTSDQFEQYVSHELAKSDERMDEVIKRITAIEEEQNQARTLLAKNTLTIERVESNTKEMLDVFGSWKGAMRVLEMLGKLAKPVGYIATMVAAIMGMWVAFKAGVNRV